MTDGYVERRREYVASIRSSFENGESGDGAVQPSETDPEGLPVSFFRLELAAAVVVLGMFLYLLFSGNEIYGYYAKDIMEMVSDNHYYVQLQEYAEQFVR